MDKELFDITKHRLLLEAQLNSTLIAFGDDLAKRNNYKKLTGLEAIHFYLIEKYHWQISYVKSLSYNDLQFVLTEEMYGWTLPEELRNDN